MDDKKNFKKLKERNFQLEMIVSSLHKELRENKNENQGKDKIKVRSTRPTNKKIKKSLVDPQIIKLLNENYSTRLSTLVEIRGVLESLFRQHPVVLEFERREEIKSIYEDLLASYEKSRNNLNQFSLEVERSYNKWLNLSSK